MSCNYITKLILLIPILYIPISAYARFPFSFSKPTIKTDYSQTVWDQIMQDQAKTDIRRGLAEMAKTDYKSASNSFAKSIIKNTKEPLGYLLLGASLYWEGKVDQAISEYKEALSLDSQNAMAYQLLGIAYGWKGDITQAQEYFIKANTIDPNKADTHMNLGSTYATLGSTTQALEHFRKSTELAPREPLYHYQLGLLYTTMGRNSQAKDSFKKAIALAPKYEDAILSLATLYEEEGNTIQALKLYKKAIAIKPGDYVARFRLAFLLTKTGKIEQAKEILNDTFSIQILKKEGLGLNVAYSATGNSTKDFEEQLNNFSTNLSKVVASKPIEIEVTLDYITPQDPKNSAPKTTFEKAYENLNNTNNPLSRSFKRIFTLPSASEEVRNTQLANLQQALQEITANSNGKSMQLGLKAKTAGLTNITNTDNPSNSKATYDPRIVGNDMGLWVIGKSWLNLVQEAQEDLQEYSSQTPDICPLLMGVSYLAQGNANQALTEFNKITNLDTNNYLAWLGVGTAYVILGQEKQAKDAYEKALVIQPKNKVATRNLKILKD